MNISEYTTTNKLDEYSFLWSIARLFIASLSLLIGGYPIVWKILPISGLYGLIGTLLTLSWIISGIASIYLLYRWYKNNMMIFGGKEMKDMVAFFVFTVSGINLGITGLMKQNLGMKIFNSYALWSLAGIIYIVTAVYLLNRWKNFGRRMF